MSGMPHPAPGTDPRASRASRRFFLPLLALAIICGPSGAATPDALVPTVAQTQATSPLDQLGARAWHAQGYRGKGIKVAILDSGFLGYREHLGGALPARALARSFRSDGNLEGKASQHGVLCAEVVHALAPEAELLLANWDMDRPDQFLDAVRWARQQGAQCLSCSIIMPTWSDYEGHGPTHAALTRLLGGGERPGDGLFFASAGNTAQRHWSGPFRDAGDGWHEWHRSATGSARDNAIVPWGSDAVSVELCFSQGSYEVVVFDVTARREVGRSHATATDSADALPCTVVRFSPEDGHAYATRVRALQDGSGPFHIVVLGGSLGYINRRGSIPFPGDGQEAIAVGAVDAHGRRYPYSSCGPKAEGLKPDLVAVVPFPSTCRERPFAGTSAAAPQAAALAALVWGRHPEWSARQVREALRCASRPAEAGSASWETGHGCLHLP